jgi:hypothetical protein
VLLLVAALLVWRTGWLQALLLLPVTLLRSAWAILFNQAPEDAGSIRAALFNITTDSKKMAVLVEDFLRSPGIDPQVEAHFRSFLAHQRVRSFPKLETTLDWVLQLYWVILPALVFSMMCNMMAKKQPASSESGESLLESPGGSPTHQSAARTASLRRHSGQRMLSSHSGSLGVQPAGQQALSRPSSSGALGRGLSGADLAAGALSSGSMAVGPPPRKMF